MSDSIPGPTYDSSPLLILDDHHWPMPSLTVTPSERRLRVWRYPMTPGVPHGHIAIITEAGEGTSVTNVAVQAYAAVRQTFPDARVFEHYPASTVGSIDDEEHFDEIVIEPNGRPTWNRWAAAMMAEWLGDDVLDSPLPRIGE